MDEQRKLSEQHRAEYAQLQWEHRSLLAALRCARLALDVDFATAHERFKHEDNFNMVDMKSENVSWEDEGSSNRYMVVTIKTEFGSRKFQFREGDPYSQPSSFNITGGYY